MLKALGRALARFFAEPDIDGVADGEPGTVAPARKKSLARKKAPRKPGARKKSVSKAAAPKRKVRKRTG